MKKLTYLLVIFALLVSFTSCTVYTEPGDPYYISFAIVNNSDVTLTIESMKIYETDSVKFASGWCEDDTAEFWTLDLIKEIVAIDILPDETREIEIRHNNESGYLQTVSKINCTYGDNKVPFALDYSGINIKNLPLVSECYVANDGYVTLTFEHYQDSEDETAYVLRDK